MAFLAGLQAGMGLRQQRELGRQQQELQRLGEQYFGAPQLGAPMEGQRDVLGEIAAIDYQRAAQLQSIQQTRAEQQQVQRKQQLQQSAAFAQMVLDAPPEKKQTVYRATKTLAGQQGMDVSQFPEMYGPEVESQLQGIVEFEKGFYPGEEAERKIETDIAGRKRYVDTGELVFPEARKEEEGIEYGKVPEGYYLDKRTGRIRRYGGLPAEEERGIRWEEREKALGKTEAADIDLYKSMVSTLPELEENVVRLKELGKEVPFTLAQRAGVGLKKQLGITTRAGKARKEYIAIVDNQILPLLRQTFGAQFTEREGQTLKKTLGDPNATPEEKEVILDAFINQKISDISAKARKLGIEQPRTRQKTQQIEQSQRLKYDINTGGII